MAWKELFSTDIGLLSVFTIGFVLVIAVFFMRYFSKKIEEDTRNQKK
ncbi:MAG: DUF3149 domain-containing protein [Zoogloeaceae bacterium]|jgi:hypothetical protein|nr:DUF3149 domain-containing protein [Zoogloeaceae bacterium]